MNSSEKRFPQHFRWNFGVYMVDMISFFFAGSFFNADTVVASMLGQVTSAAPLVGLAGTIYRLGWTVPQLVAAHVLRRQPRKKPYLVPGVIGRLISLVALVAAIVGGAASDATALLVVVYLSQALFAASDGFLIVSWSDILARAIPVERRGRLFGISQAVGGLLGVGSGMIVTRILEADALLFPINYGVLFALGLAALAPSSIALLSLREPPPDADVSASGRVERAGWLAVLRSDGAFRRLMGCRLLSAASLLCTSYYALHATEAAHLPISVIGRLVIARTIGGAAASLAFGWVSERFGPAAVIKIGVGTSLLAPLLGLLAEATDGRAWMYYGMFMSSAAWASIASLGFFNYLLEIAPADLRPVYFSAGNTLMGVTTLAPVIGGWALEATSYSGLFGITALVIAVAFLLSRRVGARRAVAMDVQPQQQV